MTIADLTDVAPDTSADDIKAYAEQVIKEVEADRAGEGKSDAQLTSEHAGIPQPSDKPKEIPAEDKSGSKPAIEDGERSGTAEDSPEWLTDDVRAEATAYGIEESELIDFASREEFDRALRLFDKRAIDAGRKALDQSETQTRNEKGQFVKKEEPKADPLKEEAPRDGRYQVSLDPDVYDDDIIGEFTRMRDHYESRLEKLESHFAQASVLAEEQRFDSEIDKLSMPKLFGVTGSETAEEIKRREDVLAQAKVLQAGHKSYGRDVPIETLVKRSAQIVFASEFEKQLLKHRTRSILKQSNSRLGGSPTKPLPPSGDPREEADRLYKEMERG